MLFILLAAITALAASPPGSSPGRATRLEIDRVPLKLHDRSEGWAEYPDIAIGSEYIALAYSVNEDGASKAYYHLVHRETGKTTGVTSLVGVDENGFWPSVDVLAGSQVWIAWTDFGRSGWSIEAFVDESIGTGRGGRRITVYDGGGFSSQVEVECGENSAWFAWTSWHEGTYSILARRCSSADFRMGDVITIAGGDRPVGRPDILVLADDHIVVAWDEYADGRLLIRARALEGGALRPIRDLSGPAYSFDWGPHLTDSGEDILVTWQTVPGGERHGEPQAATYGGGIIRQAIGRADDDETWRVRCMENDVGLNTVAWATRRGYRRTKLMLRAMSNTMSSRTVHVEFPMRKVFMNWFDCHYDGNLVLAYEAGGSLYLYDVEAPRLADLLSLAESDTTSWQPRGSKPRYNPGPQYSTQYEGQDLHVFFGDYHNHTSFSDGRAYPDISYLTARDHRGLDFMGISDHDDTTTPGELSWNFAVCDCLTRNGEYVCLYGYEANRGWATNGFGHWNALLWEKGGIFRFDDGMTPDDHYRHAKRNDVILIPHHIGVSWAPHSWDYFDPAAEPVVEICSIHGIYENLETCSDTASCVEGSMFADGLANGYRFGTVGGSDYHNCFGAILQEHALTGVYAEELTRAHIMDAIRRRRTFATTGDKIIVDFRCNGMFMGETISGEEPLQFTAFVKSAAPIVRAEVVSDGAIVHSEEIHSTESTLDWHLENPGRESYFYLRVTTETGEMAWSSPIFLTP
jgi:hypothetical protein